MSYACVRRFHYILLEIKLEQGLVTVLDSRQKDPTEYADMTEMLEELNQSLSHHIGNFVHFLISSNCFLCLLVGFGKNSPQKLRDCRRSCNLDT